MVRFLYILIVGLALSNQMASAQPVVSDSRVDQVQIEEQGRSGIRTVIRLHLREPLERKDLLELYQIVRRQINHTDAVAVRFTIEGWNSPDREPDVGRPTYAWRFYAPARTAFGHKLEAIDVFQVSGIPPSEEQKQLANLRLQSGETLHGIWIDRNHILGLVALIKQGSSMLFMHVADADRRWSLRSSKGPLRGKWLEAQYVMSTEPGGKRFTADGNGSDRLAVHLPPDGTLRLHDGREKLAAKPWLIALPLKQ